MKLHITPSFWLFNYKIEGKEEVICSKLLNTQNRFCAISTSFCNDVLSKGRLFSFCKDSVKRGQSFKRIYTSQSWTHDPIHYPLIFNGGRPTLKFDNKFHGQQISWTTNNIQLLEYAIPPPPLCSWQKIWMAISWERKELPEIRWCQNDRISAIFDWL